jgi:hypothetical protein
MPSDWVAVGVAEMPGW